MQDEGFEARFATLEAAARRGRLGISLLMVCVALLTGATAWLRGEQQRLQRELATTQLAIEQGLAHTRTLAITDGEGAVRARLGVDADNATFLELEGPDGASGLRLVAGSAGSAIVLTDPRVQRAELGWRAEVSGADRSTLRLTDRAGKTRAEFVTGDAVPTLNLYNEQGVQTAGVP